MTVDGGGGGGPGVLVVGGGVVFVDVTAVVAFVVIGLGAGTVDVDFVRCDRVDVVSARVGLAGAAECEPAMMTAPASPPARRTIPANA